MPSKSTMRLGKVPWVLRWALMLALLRGTYVTISVDASSYDTMYRFEVRPASVDRWLRRRQRVNAAKMRKATAAEDRAVKRAARRMGVKPPTEGPDGHAGDSGASEE
jgi:hypothetical protein